MLKQKACEFEPQTIKAVRSGSVNDEISAHLKSCANCREAAKVVAFFQTNFKDESPALPAAGFIWWKSKIDERRRRAEQVGQPILVAQIAAAVFFLAAPVWFLASKSGASSESFSGVGNTLAAVSSLAAPLVVGIAFFALVSLLFALALRRYFPEK